MHYKCKVVNCYSLHVRQGPSVASKAIAWLQKDDVVSVTASSGSWYYVKKGADAGWSNSSYLKVIEDLEKKQTVTKPSNSQTNAANKGNAAKAVNINTVKSTIGALIKQLTNTEGVQDGLVNISSNKAATSTAAGTTNTVKVASKSSTEDLGNGVYYINTNSMYPKKIGGTKEFPEYSWEMNHAESYNGVSITSLFNTISKNIEIPSYFTRDEITKKYHMSFNRFRKDFPDLYLRNTMSVVIFTRPDLNLFDGDKIDSYVASDPRSNLILNNHKILGQLLTAKGTGKESHQFNPLLSNLAQSLEIADDSVDVLETGETFTGYKMQYSKHNIKSITSGTLSIKYKETHDIDVTNMHQLWVDYQSNVYRGIFTPKREYIYNKELDYACDIYYFLLDQDGETIKFWSKYYGVFPHNVPKSVYSYDFGSQVSLPELNVTYSYIYKEDLSPISLIEFNQNADINEATTQRVTSYEQQLGHSGKTWVGTPFVYSYTYNNGLQSNVQGFKLGWKQ